jgi:5-methyltetrahydrofolate--homocysteine methyltransferase
MLLQSAGFEVYDLGIDVSAEKIVEAVKKYNIQIVGLSALLTTTLPEIKNIINKTKNIKEVIWYY